MGSNQNDDEIRDDGTAPVQADVAPPHGRELTGRELLAAAQRDDRNVPALLDPRTAAELARWFEHPALAHSGQAAPSSADTADSGDSEASLYDQAQKIRATAMAAAKPEFLASIERWNVSNDAIRHDDSYAVAAAHKFDTVTTAIDQFVHRLVLQTPVRRERPMDLEDAMQECTPQALLRDLHRPVDFFSRELQLEATRESIFESKTPVTSFFLQPATSSFTVMSELIRESLTWLRELHDRSWATIETDNRRPEPEAEASP